jgi:hypothetical protein
MNGAPNSAMRSHPSAASATGPGPASNRTSGPAASCPATTTTPPIPRASQVAWVPSATAAGRCPDPYNRAVRAVVPWDRKVSWVQT